MKKTSKLSDFQSLVAICKSIMGLGFVIVPSGFVKGGYLFSPSAVIVSALLTVACF